MASSAGDSVEDKGALAGREEGTRGRVRKAILATARSAFLDLVTELRESSNQLEFAIRSRVPEGPFQDLLESWMESYRELKDARAEWSSLLNEQEYAAVQPLILETFAELEPCRQRAYEYVDFLLNQTAEQTQVEALQREVARLQAELERTRVGSEAPGQVRFSSGTFPPRASSSRIPGDNGHHVRGTPETPWMGTPEHITRYNPEAPPFTPSVPTATSTVLPQQTCDQSLKTVVEMLIQSRNAERLPEVKPAVFSGNIMDFPRWWSTFRVFVEKKTDCPHERLNILGQFTTGDAEEAIKPFMHKVGDETAYEDAKNMLFSQFGDKLKLSAAYRDKLNKWPVIQFDDAKALRAFSNFLWQCEAVRESAGYLGNLDNPEENLKFLRKLPEDLRRRWNRIVTKRMCKNSFDSLSAAGTAEYAEFPPFSEFCTFIAEEAKIADGPCVVKGEPRRDIIDKGDKYKPPHRRAGVFGTGASEQPVPCLHCKGKHHLSGCDSFLALPYEEKKALVCEHHLCYGCLRTGHGVRTCRNRNPKLMSRPQKASSMNTTVAEWAQGSTGSGCCTMIVQAWLSHVSDRDRAIKVYVVLDSQADSCFVTPEVLGQLAVTSEPVSLELTTMHTTSTVKSSVTKGLLLKGYESQGYIRLPGCYARDDIPVDRDAIPRAEYVKAWPHLSRLQDKIPKFDPNIPVGILVGYNCASAMLPLEVVSSTSDEPYGIRTELGWSVLGEIKNRMAVTDVTDRATCHQAITGTPGGPVTSEEICRAFDFDFSRPGDDSFKKRSQEDSKFIKIMEEGIRFREDGHVELPLPVKDHATPLPNSRRGAYCRAMQLKRRMERDTKFGTGYTKSMEDIILGNKAERVTDEMRAEMIEEGLDELVLPHQGVYHPKKPDKPVRPVWDGGAETDGVSLNSLLMTGPDMGNRLFGVLLRFRTEPDAFTSDVKKMFFQVYVPCKQRNLQKFLWFPGGDTSKEPVEYRLTIHMFGASSSPACAMYAFRAVAERYGAGFRPEVPRYIKENFYVDDGCGAVSGEDVAVDVILGSHELCAMGGFHLCQFASNSKSVMEKVPENLRADDMNVWLEGKKQVEPRLTLGMLWNFVQDTLQYLLDIPRKELTRRGMLSMLGSVYDPLGLISPAVLPGRLILQELCKRKFQWDQAVDEEFIGMWKPWYDEIVSLNTLQVPRCFRRTVNPDITAYLHVYGDACIIGLGACVYLILTDPSGNEDVSLVAAKSRVGPIKHTTVPRLELQAAVMAVQLEEAVETELPYDIAAVEYFSDSLSALGYIYNDVKRVQLFVANRAQKIRSRSKKTQWHHVDTDLNPADIASRGATVEQLRGSELWWNGPPAAYRNEKLKPVEFTISDDDPELKKPKKSLATRVRETWALSKFERYLRLDRMTRVMVIVQRCIAKLAANRLKKQKDVPAEKRRHTIEDLTLNTTVEEQETAVHTITRLVQSVAFGDTRESLNGFVEQPDRRTQKIKKGLLQKGSEIYRLDPFFDRDGVLCVGGRVRRSEFPEGYVHPILLPGKNFFSKVVVEECHRQAKHSGRNITLNMVRANGWWIVGGKALVDRVLKACVTCRRARGPLECQKMSNLPEERVTPAPPFTYCGADFMGPYLVKERRSVLKRYLCLFTCMTVRAVHLEVCDDLTTSSFILAFRRFVDRRGPVRSLATDRGTNFVGFRNEMTELLAGLDYDEITRVALSKNCDVIEHRFNTPHAPHHGGVWERLVGVVKSILDPILIRSGERLNTESLRTVATEVEAIVNSRPVTALDMTDADSPPALSPAMLLTSKLPGVKPPPPGEFVEEDMYCQRQWKRSQVVADQFWYRWRREYLPLLQQRNKWQVEKPNLEPGDVVIVHSDHEPRMSWPMGIITSVKTSQDDGLVRSVTVRTGTGSYERPVNKLVLLYRPEKGDSTPVEEPL